MTRSISTRTGDDGTTGLMFGQRVAKNHPRIEAVGCFDELNVSLGLVKACALQSKDETSFSMLVPLIEVIQKQLISLMGELAASNEDQARYLRSSFGHLIEENLTSIDQQIAALEAQNLKFDGWATPGKTPLAAHLDWARVTARKAERQLIELKNTHQCVVRDLVIQFTNRVSDLLWLLARQAETIKN